jgi:hypothetical protein
MVTSVQTVIAVLRAASKLAAGYLVIGVVNVAMTFVAIWLIDWVGRNPLLLTGLVGMGLSLSVLGLSSLLLPQPSNPTDPAAIITLL